jgi:hypothetical protein
MAGTPEFDPDVDLADQISSYTDAELKQLETITLEIIKHWEDMLKVAGGRMNEGTKMAIDLSMEQAQKDLKLIREKMTGDKSQGSSPHGQVSNPPSSGAEGSS